MRVTRQTVLSVLADLSQGNARTAARRQPDEAGRTTAALETMRRIFSSMSDKAYDVHLAAYDEDHSTPSIFKREKPPIVRMHPRRLRLIPILLLFSLYGLGQKFPFDTTVLQKVDPWLLRSFSYAQCRQLLDTTYVCPGLPTMIRSAAVGSVYEFTDKIPFRIFWTPYENAQKMSIGYHVQSGMCRGFTFTLPAPVPGVYTTIFDHPEKPCVMQITITPKIKQDSIHLGLLQGDLTTQIEIKEGKHYAHLRFFQRCRPDVLTRTFQPLTAHMAMPKTALTTIKVFYKPQEPNGEIRIPDDLNSYTLLQTTETAEPEAFRYHIEQYGLYIFQFSNPHHEYIKEENLRVHPDTWGANSGMYHKMFYRK